MKNAIPAYLRAILWGSVVGGGPFLVITIPTALQASDWMRHAPEMIWFAFMPLAIAGAVVTLVATFLGLPLTAWLARNQAESVPTYVIAGLGVGFVLPVALIGPTLGISLALIVALPGAFAGAATAMSWGIWRARVSSLSNETAGCGGPN